MTVRTYLNDQSRETGSGNNENTLDYNPKTHRILVGNRESKKYVHLSDHDKRELAFNLLEDLFDVQFPSSLGSNAPIKLVKKAKPRPPVRVGQFYRVKGEPGMDPTFSQSPIVRVTKVASPKWFSVAAPDGATSNWQNLDTLTGPLDPTEVAAELTGGDKATTILEAES